MNEIFDFVYHFLKWVSSVTGLSYREVNIVVYFMVIPSLFFYLISRMINKKYPIVIFLMLTLLTLVIIPDFQQFSDQLFERSVNFLKAFEVIGLNYVQASVVICVFIPMAILTILIYFRKTHKLKDHS